MDYFRAASLGRGTILACIIVASFITSQTVCEESRREAIISKLDKHQDVHHLRESLVNFLFGDQWPFGRYCSSQLSASEKVANDVRIESLYNGSYLGSLDGSSDWQQVPTKLAAAIGISMKSRRELSIFCPSSSWGYASTVEELLADAPKKNDELCAKELEGLYEFVETLTNQTNGKKCQPSESCRCKLWGAGVTSCLDSTGSSCPQVRSYNSRFQLHYYYQFHSFGRLPSGPPYKQNLLVGDYDNCIRLESTRYCLGSYGDSFGTDESALYQIGLCLPRACSDSFLRHSSKHMRLLNSIVRENLPQAALPSASNHQLQDVFCPPAEDSLYMKLSGSRMSLVLLSLPLPWMALLIYATFFHRVAKPHRRSLMSSFNVSNNLQAFLDSRDLDPRLAGLSGVKTLAMVWLMVTHFSMTIFPYVKNLNELNLYYGTSIQGPLILQGQHIVPSFFIISGLLVGFKYLSNRQQPIDFKHMLLWRYSRLMPMYLLFWLYVRQFVHLLGTGPLWDSGVSSQSEVRQCKLEAWWVPLLMLANFTPPYAHCLITGWHIANDFQIYLILPPLLLAYRRSRPLGAVVAIAAFVLSHLSHVWLWGTSQNFDLLQVMRDPARFGPRIILERMSFDYVNPLGRVGTYFLGVVLADIVVQRAKGQSENSDPRRDVSGNKHYLVTDENNSRANDEMGAVDGVPCAKGEQHHLSPGGQRAQQRCDSGRRRRSSATASAQINVDVSSSLDEQQQQRRAAVQLLEARKLTDKNNSTVEAREEILGLDQRASANDESVRMIDATTVTVTSAAAAAGAGNTITSTTANNKQSLTKFKDICVFSLGLGNFAFVMFSIMLSPDQVPSLGDHTKAIAYPALRISIELSWSILLYYLLRSNSTQEGFATSCAVNCGDNKATAGGARNSQLGYSPSRPPKAMGENKLLMVTTTPHAAPVSADTSRLVAVVGPAASKEEKFIIGSGIARLFKLPLWNVLVRLNYALMLTHYALMRFVIQTQRDLFHFTWVNFSQFATFLVLASYLLALVVHLTIEMPLSALVRRFVSRVFPAQDRRTAEAQE